MNVSFSLFKYLVNFVKFSVISVISGLSGDSGESTWPINFIPQIATYQLSPEAATSHALQLY